MVGRRQLFMTFFGLLRSSRERLNRRLVALKLPCVKTEDARQRTSATTTTEKPHHSRQRRKRVFVTLTPGGVPRGSRTWLHESAAAAAVEAVTRRCYRPTFGTLQTRFEHDP